MEKVNIFRPFSLLIAGMLIASCQPDMQQVKRTSEPTFLPPTGEQLQSNLQQGETGDGKGCIMGYFPGPDNTIATAYIVDEDRDGITSPRDMLYVKFEQDGNEFFYVSDLGSGFDPNTGELSLFYKDAEVNEATFLSGLGGGCTFRDRPEG